MAFRVMERGDVWCVEDDSGREFGLRGTRVEAEAFQATLQAEEQRLEVGASDVVFERADGTRGAVRIAGGRASARIDGEPVMAEDGSLRFTARLFSAYPVRRYGIIDGRTEEFEEVLSFEDGAHRAERIASGAPFLNSHSSFDLQDVLGIIEGFRIDRAAEAMEVDVRLSARPEIASIRQDIQAGILRNVSGGYRVFAYRDVTPTEASAGQATPGGTRRLRRLLATDWETREGSLVAIGADPTAQNLRTPTTRNRIMDEELQNTPAGAQPNGGVRSGTEAGGTIGTTPPATETRTATPPASIPQPAVNQQATPPADGGSGEFERQRSIRANLRRAGLPLDGPLATELLDSRAVSSADATQRILEAVSQRDSTQRVSGTHSVVDSDADKAVRSLEDALSLRYLAGLLTPEEQTAIRGRMQGNPFANMRLLRMGEVYLDRVLGVRGIQNLPPLDQAGHILLTRSGVPGTRGLAGFHVTSDFASVLANVMNKGLQRQFSLTPETYSQWTVRGTLSDFKQGKRVNLGDAPRLLYKPEGGEVTFGAVSDKGENVQLLTYARGIAFGRETIVNDDLNSIMRFPRAFGGSSQQLISDLVYAVVTGNAALSDGVALFHATHGNLITGALNDLATNGINALNNTRRAARLQTGIAPGNNEAAFFLNIALQHFRVPPSLEVYAEQLTSMIQAQQVGNVNPFQGSFQSVMAEPRLEADSAIRFYLMADPATIDTIEVDYLEGEEGPQIESQIAWRADGVEMKCRLDVGVAATEHRGLYRNDGTVA